MGMPIKKYRRDIIGRVKGAGPRDWYKPLVGKLLELTSSEIGFYVSQTAHNQAQLGQLFSEVENGVIRKHHIEIIPYLKEDSLHG